MLRIIDGYVMHSDGAGLGQHLYLALDSRIPVIDVAQSRYADSRGVEVLRGVSRKPLFITSAGVEPVDAANRIERMHGRCRIPTLLKLADRLARDSAP